MTISKNSSAETFLNFEQKAQWVLHNSILQSSDNVTRLQQWQQQLKTSDTSPSVATNQQRDCLTFGRQGESAKVIRSHAYYYQQMLGIPTDQLQRLEELGERWQPEQLGTWLELNTLGVNAGWYAPITLTFNEVLTTFAPESVNRRLFYRWAQYHPNFNCIQYGEDFSGMHLRQMVLSFDNQTNLTQQYHQALALADLYKVPSFPPPLQEVLEHYSTSPLTISLWLNPEGVVKFGVRIYQPSIKLMLALAMLTGLNKTDEEALALIYSSFEQLAWVELQHTADGLTTEICFD